jgi:hypothetical protein
MTRMAGSNNSFQSTGHRQVLQRLCCGSERRPLEPHRPAPWLLRALSWLSAAIGFASLAPVALLIALNAPQGLVTSMSSGGVVALAGAVMARVASRLARPTPVTLQAAEEAG